MAADQSRIFGTAVTFSAGYTYLTFSTSIVELGSAGVIWAYCDADNTIALTFHGDNHQ